MERFQWSTSEIDKMDFFQTTKILFDEETKEKKEPLVFIDQIPEIAIK